MAALFAGHGRKRVLLDINNEHICAIGISFAADFEIRISTSSESIMPLGAVADTFSSYLQAEDYKWVYDLQPGDPDHISELSNTEQ